MGDVIQLHARASAGSAVAKASKVMSGRPLSAAKRTRAAQRCEGMPLARQVLTVLGGTSRASATALVPPRASMAVFGVSDIGVNIVRGLRTCQVFAEDEATNSYPAISIEGMKVPHPQQAARLELLRRACNKENQADWIEVFKFPKSSWSEWENGKKPLTLDAARRIKRVYGIPLDFSLDGDRAAIERMPAWIADNLRKLIA